MRVCQLVLCKSLTLFQTNTCHFPNSFLDLVSKIHTRFQALQLNRFGNHYLAQEQSIYCFSILYYHIIVFDTEHVAGKNTRFIRNCGSFENHAGFRTIIRGQNLYPSSGQNGTNAIPLGHNYISKGFPLPPSSPRTKLTRDNSHICRRIQADFCCKN